MVRLLPRLFLQADAPIFTPNVKVVPEAVLSLLICTKLESASGSKKGCTS